MLPCDLPVYGPRQMPTLEGGVVAIFLDRMRGEQDTEIFGDGNQTRDFVYVGDVVAALVAAAASRAGGTYNLGSGVAIAIRELHRLRAEIAGVAQEPRFAPATSCSTPRASASESFSEQRSRQQTRRG